MIDLSARDEDNYATPVVGSVGKDVPTSGDVHLYLDPHTADSEAPILYADCEGLEGGEREPLGAWSNTKDRSTSDQFGSIGSNFGQLQHASAREITWATTNERRSRGFAVTNLYPRLLYTFSGVIVFVLKNPRYEYNLESFEGLLDNIPKVCQGHRKCHRKIGAVGCCGFGEIFESAGAPTCDYRPECFRK